jgi:uncharacterized membrane protein YdjX (TVP38/TMEM64 family)
MARLFKISVWTFAVTTAIGLFFYTYVPVYLGLLNGLSLVGLVVSGPILWWRRHQAKRQQAGHQPSERRSKILSHPAGRVLEEQEDL